jgi:hypothetical protein
MAPDNSRDDWSPQEDVLLVRKQAERGNRWAEIKAFLPGRSLVAVKNRWKWPRRRDIPRHSQEFGAIAKAQENTTEGEEMLIPDSLSAVETVGWAEGWADESLF